MDKGFKSFGTENLDPEDKAMARRALHLGGYSTWPGDVCIFAKKSIGGINDERPL